MDQVVDNPTYHKVQWFSHYVVVTIYDPQFETLVPLVKSQYGDDLWPFCVWLERSANVEKVQHELLGVDTNDPGIGVFEIS